MTLGPNGAEWSHMTRAYCGAVAVSPSTGHYGWSAGWGTAQQAVDQAVSTVAQSDAQWLLWADRQYIALARTVNGRFFTTSSQNANPAAYNAQDQAGPASQLVLCFHAGNGKVLVQR
jgi:Domain of unknown function (DUF4189)